MEHTDYRLAAVMFTDIVGFSRMMEEDEPGTLKTLDFHNKLVRESVEKYRGSVIKTIGDAFLAQFSTTLDAVHCSLDVQNAIREYNEAKIGKPLTLRIGVHLGDIYFYENDALGEGINIASRLQGVTKPGSITISREVYSQVSGKIPMRIESMGQVHLKNISREVHAYEIIPGGEDNNSSQFLRSQKAAVVVEEPAVTTPPPSPRRAGAESTGGYGPPRGGEPSGPPPSFRDLRDEWKSIKDRIRAQVEEQVHQATSEISSRDTWRDNRRELRHQFQGNPVEFLDTFMRDPLSKLKNEDGSPASPYQVYKQKKLRKVERSKQGWRSHLSSYISVNAFLIFICYATQGASIAAYPWFLYPLLGWGIGVAGHWVGNSSLKKTQNELLKIDDLPDSEFREMKTFQDTRSSFRGHIATVSMVSFLLAMIGIINDNSGALLNIMMIPIGILVLTALGRVGNYQSAKSKFKKVWDSVAKGTLPKRGSRPASVAPVATDPIVAKAQALRDSIIAQAQGMKGGNPFGDDMTPTLDNYVLQISELSSIEREIGRVVTGFGAQDLEAEEAVLRKKIEGSNSATLKAEYEKSLGEIDKQKKSFADLSEQQEILGLRITSSVKNLQQMQIDLARIKGLSDGQKEGYFMTIKDRSEELSRYIEDYREGLKEGIE